jgi:hypothetical protein
VANYTSNYNLYKPNIDDADVEVAPSLETNFVTIDAEIKNRADELVAHTDSSAAHDSANITHGDGSVQETLFDLGGQVTDVDKRISEIVAQTGTDNTELVDARGGYPVLRDRLKNISIDVTELGAVCDGVTDDTLAINNAINAAIEGQTVVIPGNSRTTDTIIVTKNINLVITGSIIADHNNAAIKFDGLGRGTYINCHHRISVRSNVINHTDTTSIGLLVRNCYNQIFDVHLTKDFYYGLKLEADLGKGCVYNEFNLMAINNNRKQIHLSGLDGVDDAHRSWINQNTFMAGRISWTSTVTRTDFTGIQIGNSATEYLCNGNVFLNPSIEDIGVTGVYAKAVDVYGHDNMFIGTRTEGALSLLFETSSYNNKWIGGFYSNMSNVQDLGNANEFDFARGGFVKWALNNANGNVFAASGTGTHAAKFYNKTSANNPIIGIYQADGTTLAVSLSATGLHQWRSNVQHSYGNYTAPPTTGTWNRNDVVWKSSPSQGGILGWICITGGVDTAAVWVEFGQAGYRTGTSAPSGTPLKVGEDWLDTTNRKWYKAVGLTSADWVALN